jgi:hypothetical protein
MKKIHAKDIGAQKVIFYNEKNEEIQGFKIDLRTQKTETYILLTKEELKPIIEKITENFIPDGFYI